MTRCWAQDPHNRPTFFYIQHKLQEIRHSPLCFSYFLGDKESVAGFINQAFEGKPGQCCPHSFRPNLQQCKCRFTKWLRLEGTSLKPHSVPAPVMGGAATHHIRLPSAQSNLALNTSRDGWGIHSFSGQHVPVPHTL